jgi:60 kDa SS-A/Ro ribonucleoprotein
MSRYGEHVSGLATPQSERARADQVQNSAGGHVFALDKWKRLDRFIVLGSAGGSYYVAERELTKANARCVDECLAEDGERTVARIVEISDAGRAPKNDPAIFALAMAAGHKNPLARAAALAALPKVCRTGTHLFSFVADAGKFRRWGRSLRRAVSAWYLGMPVDKLALQLVKYQQRGGWAHRDVLRLAHPDPVASGGKDRWERNAALRWAVGGRAAVDTQHNGKRRADGDKVRALVGVGPLRHYGPMGETLPALIQAFDEIMAPRCDKARAIALITEHKLPHECVPNELKGDPQVWAALLPHMGITALIRNLGKLTAVGLLQPMSHDTLAVAARLTDSKELFAGRVHPIALLLALTTYRQGQGLKGSLAWAPQREIVDALDAAFYMAFDAIEPTGKRHMLALDVSGSMDGSLIAGTRLSAREASAAMAMVTARAEKAWHAVGFASGGGGGYGGRWGGAASQMVPVAISPKQRLDDVCRTMAAIPMGGTDCALPMLYAAGENIPVDVFVVYTDSETWAGNVHPHQALAAYRNKTGISAKLIVVGMCATEFSIADPEDAGQMDVVGFDAAAPGVMADFIADREVRG